MPLLGKIGHATAPFTPPPSPPATLTVTVGMNVPVTFNPGTGAQPVRIVVSAWRAGGVSDSKGNTYALDATEDAWQVWSAEVTTALVNGVDTITVSGTFGFEAVALRNIDPAAPFHAAAGAHGSYLDDGFYFQPQVPTTPALTLDGFDELIGASGAQTSQPSPSYWLILGTQQMFYPNQGGDFFDAAHTVFQSGGAAGHDWADLSFYHCLGGHGSTADVAPYMYQDYTPPNTPTPTTITWAGILVAYHTIGWGGGGGSPDLLGDLTSIHNRWPYYWRAGGAAGNQVAVHRADYPVPTSYPAQVIVAAGSQPCLGYEERRNRLRCIYRISGGAVHERFSDDDAVTWSSATVAFTSGKHPVIAVCPQTGFILRAVYDGGVLKGTLADPDGTTSAVFTLKDDMAANIAVEDERFDISWAYDGKRSLLLAVKLAGHTTVSDFVSHDDGASFTPL